MIRRIGLATIVTGLVLATGAQAATKITLQCVRSQKTQLRSCVSDCKSKFLNGGQVAWSFTGEASCFGPGAQCASQCNAQNTSQCVIPTVNTPLNTCIQGADPSAALDCTDPTLVACTPVLKCALQVCTAKGQADPTFDVEACGNKARLANLQCQLNCRSTVEQAQLTCATNLGQCLAGCASCATPADCPSAQ
jgi:hypothetical protein